MPTRVSTAQQTDNLISQMMLQTSQLQKVQQELSTGIRVANPGDDPTSASAISDLKNTLTRVDGHKQRITYAQGFLDSQDSALTTAESLMERAQEIATQAANETVSASERATMAAEVFHIRDELVALANTKYQGTYVWGGAADATAPVTSSTYTNPAAATDPAKTLSVFVAGTGTQTTRSVAISDDNSVELNTPADDVFLNSIVSVETLGRAMAGYRTTVAASVNPNLDGKNVPTGAGTAYTFPTDYSEQTTAIQAALDNIQSARSTDIEEERANIGARMNLLDRTNTLLDNLKSSTENSRSALQDADPFAAASQFASLQTSLQALLASGAQINNLSLLDYI